MEGSLKVSTVVDKKDFKKLAAVSYDNAKDTLKDGKIDPVVFLCGLFAIGCFGVSLYNGIKNGFDLVMWLLMAAYVAVAVICVVKPVQKALGKWCFGLGFGRRLKLNKDGVYVNFDENAMNYELGDRNRTVFYDSMWTAYETAGYYVFHVSDELIVPVSKAAVTAAAEQKEGLDEALAEDFFKLIVSKADGTCPEEEVPDITR